jgi:hypothetical protein
MQRLAAPNFGDVMKSSSRFIAISICLLTLSGWNLIFKIFEQDNQKDQRNTEFTAAHDNLSPEVASGNVYPGTTEATSVNRNRDVLASSTISVNPNVTAKSMEDLIMSFKKEQEEMSSKAGLNPFMPN